MGYNSAHQTMSLAFADRGFYYGDPDFGPQSLMQGILSKQYAWERAKLIQENNMEDIGLGDPCPFQGGSGCVEGIKGYRGGRVLKGDTDDFLEKAGRNKIWSGMVMRIDFWVMIGMGGRMV